MSLKLMTQNYIQEQKVGKTKLQRRRTDVNEYKELEEYMFATKKYFVEKAEDIKSSFHTKIIA